MIGSMSNRAKFKILTATPKNNFTATGAPTTSDDIRKGYSVGSKWLVASTGNEWTCKANGTGAAKWSHTPRVLGQSGVAVSCPADITEDTLATVTLPANAMGLNGVVRITSLWTVSSSGNTKTVRTYFGGTGGTKYLERGVTTNTVIQHQQAVRNRGASNSQVGMIATAGIEFAETTGSLTTSAIDTTSEVNVVFTGQKANSGDTLTLAAYCVELLLPDIG